MQSVASDLPAEQTMTSFVKKNKFWGLGVYGDRYLFYSPTSRVEDPRGHIVFWYVCVPSTNLEL